MSAWDDFKNSLKTWQTGLVAILAFLSLVTGALGDFIGLLSPVPVPYLSLAKVALLYIGALILIWLFTHSIITRRKRITGITRTEKDPLVYSLAGRRFAWAFRILSLLLIIPLFLWGYQIKDDLVQDCSRKSRLTGVLISRFSNNPDDQFSFHLYNYLSNNLNNDSIKIATIDHYISLTARANFEDSLSPLLECYKDGLIVFGSRNLNEKSFLCNLYSRDIKTKGQKVIDMPGTPSIEVPIDYQSDFVGKFVLTQLHYKLGNNQQSLAYIDTLLKTEKVRKDSALTGFCFLYQGLNQLQTKQYEESIKSFELAANFDKKRPEIQNAISYMRGLKFYRSDLKDPLRNEQEYQAQVTGSPNFFVKKGFVVNDSIGYTISDYRGITIKDTVLPYNTGKFIIVPSESKYYTVYLGSNGAFQLGKGLRDSLQIKHWLDSIGTKVEFRKDVLATEAHIRNWEKASKGQEKY